MEKDYLEETVNLMKEKEADIIPMVKEWISKFFKELILLQQDVEIPVGFMQLSLLRTSIYFGKPVIQMDAYDERGVFGRHLLTMEMPADWLFPYWEQEKKDRVEQVIKEGTQGIISKEQIRVEMSERIKMYVYVMAQYLKYPLEQLDEVKGFNQVLFADHFICSAGEYLDWQKTVFWKRPQIDIFLNPEQESLQFQKYKLMIYKKKEFVDQELLHVRFTDCHFIQSHVENTNFTDCNFIGCRFHNVTFHNCIFYGAKFLNCRLENVTFEDTKWHQEIQLGKVSEICRNAYFDDSVMEQVSIINSDLRSVKIYEPHLNHIKITECQTEDSDFKGVNE